MENKKNGLRYLFSDHRYSGPKIEYYFDPKLKQFATLQEGEVWYTDTGDITLFEMCSDHPQRVEDALKDLEILDKNISYIYDATTDDLYEHIKDLSDLEETQTGISRKKILVRDYIHKDEEKQFYIYFSQWQGSVDYWVEEVDVESSKND